MSSSSTELDALEHLTRELDSAFASDPKGKSVAKLMETYARAAQDWREHMLFAPAGYSRNLLRLTPVYELLLLCWDVGQASPIHNHQEQRCWMAVLDGAIRETHFHEPDEGHKGPLKAGSVRCFRRSEVAYISDEIALHEIRPIGVQAGVTLHLYSSPIPRCRVYCEVTGKVAIREMSYDSVRPGAVADGLELPSGS